MMDKRALIILVWPLLRPSVNLAGVSLQQLPPQSMCHDQKRQRCQPAKHNLVLAPLMQHLEREEAVGPPTTGPLPAAYQDSGMPSMLGKTENPPPKLWRDTFSHLPLE